MMTLYRQRLLRALRSIPTIVCIGLLMLFSGVLTVRFNLAAGTSSLQATVFYLSFAAALLLPAVVLLLVGRLHVRGEQAYLAALPISPFGLQLAHALAALTLFGISLLPLLLSPPLFSLFGSVNFASAYVAILGYALFGCTIITVTQAIATWISHTAARIGVCYGVVILLVLIGALPAHLPLSDTAIRTVSGLSPLAAMEGFLYGQFYLPGVLCMLLLSVSCLFVGTVALLCRRGGLQATAKRAAVSSALALVISCSLALGAIVQWLPRSVVYFDVTGSDTFSVSGQTRDFLRTLDEDVTVYYLCEGGRRNAYRNLEVFLEEYADASSCVRVEYIDTKEQAAFSYRYTPDTLNDHSLIVVGGGRHYVIDAATFYHYYNAELNQHFSSQYYAYCLDAADYYTSTGGSLGSYDQASVEYGSALYLYSEQTTAYFDGDALLANAILYVTGDATETVYVLCDKDVTLESNLRAMLQSNGYFFKHVDRITSLDGCDLLLIYSPARDLDESERELLCAYMASGGDALLATSCAYDDFPNLLSITKSYGLDVAQNKNMLAQKDASGTYTTSFYASVDTSSPASGGWSGRFAMLAPHVITMTPIEGVTHTEWITTTAAGSYFYANEVGDDATITDEVKELLDMRADTYVCGAIAQKGDSSLIWISSALSLGLAGYSYSGGGNYSLVLAALDFATENEFSPLSIEPRAVESQAISPTSGELAVCAILLLVLCPIALALPAGLRIYIRKKR